MKQLHPLRRVPVELLAGEPGKSRTHEHRLPRRHRRLALGGELKNVYKTKNPFTFTFMWIVYAALLVGCQTQNQKPEDQYALAMVACNASYDWPVREAAVKKLADQNLLEKVACEGEMNFYVCEAALSKLTNQNALAEVCFKCTDSRIMWAALDKLTDQNLLAKILCEYKSYPLREAAIIKLTDHDLLVKVVGLDTDLPIRHAAVEKLTDQTLLTKLTCDDKDWEIRKASFNKLDSAHLITLAENSKDPALGLAVKVRLQREQWGSIFEPTNLVSTGFGTVLGAVALVDNPQPDNHLVVKACHTVIRQGDYSRIAELGDLLDRFGDKDLAEDYLNCGQEQLHRAGWFWAQVHGYSVSPGSGSQRVIWGGGR